MAAWIWPWTRAATTADERRARLARLPHRLQVDAIRETLPLVDAVDVDAMVSMLVDCVVRLSEKGTRPRRAKHGAIWDDAVRASVLRWMDLSDPVRQAVISAIDTGGAPAWTSVRQALQDWPDQRAVRPGLVRLCREALRPELMPVIGGLLADEDAAIAEQAERALLASIDALPTVEWPTGTFKPAADGSASEIEPSTIETRQQRLGLEREVAVLLEGFASHRRRGVLLAAIALLDPDAFARQRRGSESPIVAWLGQAPAEVLSALRLIVRTGREPLTRLRAWQWLAREATTQPLAAAAIDRVGVHHGPGDHEAVLRRVHWLATPMLRTRLGPRGQPGTARAVPVALPRAGDWPKLSAEARLGAATLAAHFGQESGGAGVFAKILESAALTDPVALVRRACVRALPADKVRDACFDADPVTAMLAMQRWSELPTREQDDARWLKPLGRCASAPIRHAAAAEHALRDPWHPSPAGRLAARAWLRKDRGGFVMALRAKVNQAGGPSRLAAISLARHLGVVDAIESELLALLAASAGDASDPKLASAAITALGTLGSAAASSAVAKALRARDPRVCSNAIEALARAGSAKGTKVKSEKTGDGALHAVLVEFKDHPHHRVRATAAHALIASAIEASASSRSPRSTRHQAFEPVAVETLRAMLIDERPMHRVAAMWMVESLAMGPGLAAIGPEWSAVVAGVGAIAREDAEPVVRTRAIRCARRLLWAAGGEAAAVESTGARA